MNKVRQGEGAKDWQTAAAGLGRKLQNPWDNLGKRVAKPDWPEATGNLEPGEHAANRAFRLQLRELLADVAKRGVLGLDSNGDGERDARMSLTCC